MSAEKTPLNLPSIPDQIVAAIKHLHAMSRRAPATFEEHAAAEQAASFLLRRFKPAEPRNEETQNPPKQ